MQLKRRKPPRLNTRVRSPDHLKWVRGQVCAASHVAQPGYHTFCSGGIEAAHVRLGNHAGMGQKPGDDQTIPLCSYHHAVQHSIGEMSFEQQYRIDMKAIAADLWNRSPAGIRYRMERQ